MNILMTVASVLIWGALGLGCFASFAMRSPEMFYLSRSIARIAAVTLFVGGVLFAVYLAMLAIN